MFGSFLRIVISPICKEAPSAAPIPRPYIHPCCTQLACTHGWLMGARCGQAPSGCGPPFAPFAPSVTQHTFTLTKVQAFLTGGLLSHSDAYKEGIDAFSKLRCHPWAISSHNFSRSCHDCNSMFRVLPLRFRNFNSKGVCLSCLIDGENDFSAGYVWLPEHCG